jgi:hypothetical protein
MKATRTCTNDEATRAELMDPIELAELDLLMADAKAAFQDEGDLVSIHLKMMSLTASADGGAWSVVWS